MLLSLKLGLPNMSHCQALVAQAHLVGLAGVRVWEHLVVQWAAVLYGDQKSLTKSQPPITKTNKQILKRHCQQMRKLRVLGERTGLKGDFNQNLPAVAFLQYRALRPEGITRE